MSRCRPSALLSVPLALIHTCCSAFCGQPVSAIRSPSDLDPPSCLSKAEHDLRCFEYTLRYVSDSSSLRALS